MSIMCLGVTFPDAMANDINSPLLVVEGGLLSVHL